MKSKIDVPAIPEQLQRTRIIAILRGKTAEHVRTVAFTLAEAGFDCIELALTTPGALDALADLVASLPESVTVGAGTVRTARDAEQARDAGARFFVSPTANREVIDIAVATRTPCYPGAWTPTEVDAAWQAGATAVKLFPAASGGPAHLRALRDPLPEIPLIPTGGVSAKNAADYMRAGAVAIAVGGGLLRNALEGGDLADLTARARALLSIARDTQ